MTTIACLVLSTGKELLRHRVRYRENFPLTLSAEPPAIDVRWNHDENGHPKDAKTRQRFADRKLYIAIVRQLEQERGITEGYGLSPVLQDSQRQHLASAMRLYQSGKPGWYAKVLQEISKDG
ncbi:hypothetical protein BDV39DRAFT_166717 [Aspergillus sergii]|uniref:Uncharacterized protein n=1 Tax=Aspergillus sergii TaxID=1034303 RepID=A0A5N6XHK8_9EURO|nr:hypothetical protein BDV39DRAFT_166717 [Aspergillus sergii]